MSNWIKDHEDKEGKLPKLPDYLYPVLPMGEIQHGVKIPSGQYWNNLSPQQQEKLLQLAEWDGMDRDLYLGKMRTNLPKGRIGKR